MKIKTGTDMDKLLEFGYQYTTDKEILMIKRLNGFDVFIVRGTREILTWDKKDIEELLQLGLVEDE